MTQHPLKSHDNAVELVRTSPLSSVPQRDPRRLTRRYIIPLSVLYVRPRCMASRSPSSHLPWRHAAQPLFPRNKDTHLPSHDQRLSESRHTSPDTSDNVNPRYKKCILFSTKIILLFLLVIKSGYMKRWRVRGITTIKLTDMISKVGERQGNGKMSDKVSCFLRTAQHTDKT